MQVGKYKFAVVYQQIMYNNTICNAKILNMLLLLLLLGFATTKSIVINILF